MTFFLPAFNFADAFATTTFFAAVGFFTTVGFVVVATGSDFNASGLKYPVYSISLLDASLFGDFFFVV